MSAETKQTKLEDLSYRDLQKMCKSEGLRADGKTEELIERLRNHFEDEVKEDEAVDLEKLGEEATVEEEKKEQPKPKKDVTAVAIINKENGNVIREYSKKVHGEDFIALASKYVNTHEGVVARDK